MNTPELLERLRRHYIKPGGLAGGVFVPEVSENGGWGSGRRVDALYAGFTNASGRILVGHELKISRADWLHELDQIHKADQWADACHAWYVVAPDEAIVEPKELPHGWGLMVVNPKSKTRLTIVTKAIVNLGHVVPWWAARSLLARADTLANVEYSKFRNELESKLRPEIEKQVKESLRTGRTDETIRTILEKSAGYFATDADVDAIVAAIKDCRAVESATKQAREKLRGLLMDAKRVVEPWANSYGALAAEIEAMAR